MKTDNKTLSDVTRQNTATKANRFADAMMPIAPKQRNEAVPAQEVAESISEEAETKEPVAANTPALVPVAPKADRQRKSGSLTVEDIVNSPARDGEAFNKMVRVTDDHHELLRLMAFKYRKPMNVIVHNLIAMLDQAYQKEQKGDQSNA